MIGSSWFPRRFIKRGSNRVDNRYGSPCNIGAEDGIAARWTSAITFDENFENLRGKNFVRHGIEFPGD